MPKVVVDVNIWVSTFIKPHGRYAQLLEEISQKGELVASEEILAQAREVVLRPRIKEKYGLTEAQVDKARQAARGYATVISDVPGVSVVEADPDDNLIVACAVAAQADYIVSYDPHLTELREFQEIQILSPQDSIPLFRQLDDNAGEK